MIKNTYNCRIRCK